MWQHLDDDQTWARIAAESGYADQVHLIREFRHFTGTTPAALTIGWSPDDRDKVNHVQDRTQAAPHA